VTAISGVTNDTFFSAGGLEYFVWETDGDGMSDNLSIVVTTMEPAAFPVFVKFMGVDPAEDPVLVFNYNWDPMRPWTFPPQPTEIGLPWGWRSQSFLAVGFAFTLVLIVLALLSVAWSVHVCIEYWSEFGSPMDEPSVGNGTEINRIGPYQAAEDDEELPLPFFPTEAV
jgi:hypothetical protein